MQQSIVTTTVTDKGYILLPVKVREALKLKPRQSVEMSVVGGTLHIKPQMSLDAVFSFIKPSHRAFTQKELKKEENTTLDAIIDNAKSEGL